jgi:tetratricopeptide (TPR) repeat protein
VFAIQTDVAQRVAQVLQLRLAAAAAARAAHPTDNLAAFDTYLRGLYFASSVHAARSAAALDSGIELLQRATELDPKFALAHAMLSIQLGNRFFNYDADKRWEQAAFVEAEKALALDPELGEAHLARANLLWTLPNHFPHEQAVGELRTALALKPGLSDAHLLLGAIYFHIGLFQKALAQLEAAQLADPGNASVPPRIARVHAYQGQLQVALDEFERVPGWEPEKAWLLGSLGRFDEAQALLARVAAAPQTWARTRSDLEASEAFVLAGLKRRGEAEQAIARSVTAGDGSSHFHHAAHRIASAYALLGDQDRAVQWLERVAEEGMPCVPLFAADPNLKSLHGHARFEALLRKLNEQYQRYVETL